MSYKHGLKNKIKKCLFCNRDFVAKKDCLTRNQLFCSKKCYSKSLIGKKATKQQLKGLESGRGWNKGLKGIGGWKWSEISKKKLSLSKKGIKLTERHKYERGNNTK